MLLCVPQETVNDAYREHRRQILLDAQEWFDRQGLPPYMPPAADPLTLFAIAAYQVQL